MNDKILILDLDGVLITTPSWKSDEIAEDGYSRFNEKCIDNLNILLGKFEFKIWLSSSRRINKTLEEFNQIFTRRKIFGEIEGFLPRYENCFNRKQEIERFIEEYEVTDYLIIDDDKSLNGLRPEKKRNLVLTNFLKGFDSEKLKITLERFE